MANKRVPKQAIDKVLSLVAQGYSVAKATKEDGTCSEATFYNWLNDDEDGKKLERYTRAREDRAEHHFEEMLEIADDGSNDFMTREDGREVVDQEHIQRSRLRIETRKWMLGKMSPSKYGDKLDVQHGGNVIVEIKK
jgi:hypothetical protein